ncbi:MAG: HAMP domain-containing sensor histidine kinase, partial [Acidobacteriota bacterium]|nr:HAMP domain-containing sensor histidine kinase [Acidobacteriota bacterium]
MEALLSPRLKNIIFATLVAALAAAALWISLVPARELGETEVQARIEKDCRHMEAALTREVRECLRRSDRIAAEFAAKRLSADSMEEKEALVIEQDGIITDHVGEIFFFKPVELPIGGWQLTRKNENLFFQRRVGPREYTIRFFMALRGRSPVHKAAGFFYPVFDLKFSARPLPAARSEFSYDRAQRRFYCTWVFKAAHEQLLLSLVFSRETLERNFVRQRKISAYGLAFLLFLVLFLACGRGAAPRLVLRLLALAGMAATSWLAIEWIGVRDLYFPGRPDAMSSVFQLLVLFSCLLLGMVMALKDVRVKNNWLALIVFNLAVVAAFIAFAAVLDAVDFPIGKFTLSPAYLGLLALVIGFFAAPLLAASPFITPAPFAGIWPLLLLQAVLAVAGARWLGIPHLPPFLLALAFVILVLRTRRPWVRAIVPLLLLALATSLWLGQHSLRLKKAFVSENLKPVFSSQDDYAKLVAREIVYELNSRGIPFSALFDPGKEEVLADCWKNTLAARENIASGIYVVAGDGSLLHSFSHQIPYIPLNKEDIFPFWHVENVEADLFGKKVRLAVATINVFQGEHFMGFIMVQVLNTADLVLKSREPQSVLSADRRILDAGIGYIKLDESGRILENPANINVPGLAELTRGGGASDAWVAFSSMGIGYEGCVFKGAESTSVVFFPRDTFFNSFAEYVKVLGFLLLLAALLNLRRLRRYPWHSVFGSFSVKVFAILVLLSIITAAVFSLFSLNFNSQSQETRRSQAAHRRARSALTLVDHFLSAGGEITQSHLFLLEKVLENDISVYENGTLLFTSDHGKLVRSEIPIYLDSGVLDRLRRDNQQFELRRRGETLDLFFKTAGNYVFRMEFPGETSEQLRSRRYYLDFMVTIFFVLIVIGLAAAFFFRDKILAPIHRLNRGMADVQSGDLRPLDGIPAEIELRDLYQGFNSMLEGIQEQKRNASEIARMKTLVQLGRRVAHEVKNPLTPIRLSAEQIQRSLQDGGEGSREVIASAVRYIIEETEHLRRVAFGFLDLSKLEDVKAEPFRLNDLVGEAVAHMRRLYPRVRFSYDESGEGVDVVADRQKIKQVVGNVLTNALEALDGREGEVGVSLALEGEWALVRICDNGAGMSREDLERIAREEFSSKDLGTGLGLVIARRFLELHRGGLEIESHPGSGTIVVMR